MAYLPRHSQLFVVIPALVAVGIGISSFQAEDDSYTYDREESVLQLSLVATDGTDIAAVGGSAAVELVAEFHSWEIWSDPSTGAEEYRNATAIPASGVTVELLLPNGNGSVSDGSPVTDPEGRAVVVFTPQEVGTAELEARVGESFASLTFHVGTPSGPTESWNYSHTEATLVGILTTTDGRTELAEGETSPLSLKVHFETWDVMTNDSGSIRIENHTSAPAEGASVEWVSESGDSTVTGYSVTDSAGFAQGSLTMGSSSTNVRVDISYATGQATSASLECFVISGAHYDPYSAPSSSDPAYYDPTTDPAYYDSTGDPSYYDPATDPSYSDPSSEPSYDPAYDWSWVRTETVFSIVNLAADGPASLAAGDSRTITGQLMEESWDVWVNSGSEDYRFNYSGPASWSSLRIEPAGGGALVADTTVSTDGDGWFSTTFTMGSDSTVVDFFHGDSTDSIASVEFLLDDSSTSGGTATPEWTFIQMEGAYMVENLEINGPTYDLLPGDSRTVTGTLSWAEWEVWIDGSGTTETRNGSSNPVSPGGFDIVVEQGDGLVTPQSLAIGEDGNFAFTFTMGGEASRIAFSVDGSSQTLSPVDFSPPPPPEPFWSFSRIERSLSLSLSADAAVELLQAGVTVPLRADVLQTSWEVWEDGLGNTELRNHSTGPGIGVNVQFSLLTGPGSFALTDATTDAGGIANTAFTLGESDSDIAATVQFEGVSADARLTLAPEPWEYLRTDESLAVSLSGAGNPPIAVTAMVVHQRADVWQHRDSGATEVRSESSSPAENAVVAFVTMGATPATFGANTVTTDEFGRVLTPYASDEPVIVSAVARFAGLTATALSSLPAGSGDTGGSGTPNPGDGGSNPGDGDGNPGDGSSNPGDGGSPGDGPGNPANAGEDGEFPAVALKGRVHRTVGGKGGTDDTPGSENQTYEELIHFEVDLIRPVFGFEGEEVEPERQTLSGNSSEEYGQMQEQWEAEGWEIEELGEGVENPRRRYEDVEIQNSGTEGEYGNPHGSPLEVRGLRSGSGHDIVRIETLADEDEIRQLYEQIEETPEDRNRIYWNGSIGDMGFTTEQWSSGERILFGEDPYHPAPVMRSSAHFTTDTGVSPTVSWSEYWFQAEKEIPEGKSASKTFLIHATQLKRNSDPDAPPMTAEGGEENGEEWFGTVTFKINEQEKISTEAPEIEWTGNPPCANWVEAKSDGTLLVKPPANRNDQEGEENAVVLLPVEVDSQDRAVTGVIPNLGTQLGSDGKFEIGFRSGGSQLGKKQKYEIPETGSPQGIHIYDDEEEIFGDDELANLDGMSPERKDQEIVLVREGDGIRFFTVTDDIGTFSVDLYLDGEKLASVDHEQEADEDFERLIAAVEGFVAGDDPPEVKAWEPWPTVPDLFTSVPDNLTDSDLGDIAAAAPPQVAAEVANLSDLRDPSFFGIFYTRVYEESTEDEWNLFNSLLMQLGFVLPASGGNPNTSVPAAAGDGATGPSPSPQPSSGGAYPGPGAVKTDIDLPPEIRNRGLVSKVLIHWMKRAMKTGVAHGEGVVFGLWDGVKGDAVALVDTIKILGKVFTSPVKTASEVYHTFKTLKGMTFDEVKGMFKGMFDKFMAKQEDRLDWVLEGASEDPVYLKVYMAGYLQGYIAEQVLVIVGTAGLGAGKYIAQIVSKGSKLMGAVNLTQKIPRQFSQVFSQFVRTADEGRAVRKFSDRCIDGNCFAPGTLVLMADGSPRLIEDVERGEWIMADDPTDALPPAPRKVEYLIRSRAERTFHLEWDRDGDLVADELVKVTSEHPFWVTGRGWTPVEEIAEGNRLVTRQGSTVTVTGNRPYLGEITTYNLDVGDPHTYFVGSAESWVLVHNAEFDIVTYRPVTTPNVNHHGIMNKWLSEHFPTTYLGRQKHKDFPCIELSRANHQNTIDVERNFMIQRGLPPYGNASWKDVTPQEIIKVGREALHAANVPDADKVFNRLLNSTNGWLRHNKLLWKCP